MMRGERQVFTILRTLNIAGLGGGLVSAAVFDDRLSGLPRLALFAALAVLDLILIIWITRNPATASSNETAPIQAIPAEEEVPQPVPTRSLDHAEAAEPVRRAA